MITVVAPWLEGGGAQRSLLGLVLRLDMPFRLILAYEGSRDFGQVRQQAADVVEINAPRTALGTFTGARELGRILDRNLDRADTLYSLMRASHVMLGMVPRLPRRLPSRVAASVHMLPSDDRVSSGWRLEEAAMRRFLRRADLVTTPSPLAAAELAAFSLCPPQRVVTDPNLMPPEARPTVKPRLRPLRNVRLAFVGRIEEQKGLDRLPHLLATCADLDVEVRVAGHGRAEKSLRQAVAHLGHNHKIQLMGRVEDVMPLLDWCDALVLPSRQELNPVAVWEAWARQRPVVASSLPVFDDLRRSGPVLSFDGPMAFRRCLESLMEIQPDVPARAAPSTSALLEYLNDHVASR